MPLDDPSTPTGPGGAQHHQPAIIWWILWAAFLGGMFLMYTFLGRPDAGAERSSPTNWIGLGPFLFSLVVRWIVLPRVLGKPQAFPMFIVGIAMAEACLLTGIFLGGPQRDTLAVLGFLAEVQFIPLFLRNTSHRIE